MPNPFRYFNSSPEVIRLVVMMYVRYPLSLRNVEDLLFERGIDICHETVRLTPRDTIGDGDEDVKRDCGGGLTVILGMEVMSDAVGPGDLVLCVNVAPNHATGRPVPLRAGETYRVVAVMEFACPCGRSDALLDVGVDYGWCQTRFRLLPKPKAETKTRRISAPKEKETVR